MLTSLVDRMHGGTVMDVVVALWEGPAIGYAVWWLMDRPISRALAIWAHSYTVFVALSAALEFGEHDTAYGIFLAVQAVGLVAVPVTGRVHRRRAR
jgi:hypothetical protein